jgi:hypothetical protein
MVQEKTLMVRMLFSSVAALLLGLTSLAFTNAQTGPTGPTGGGPTTTPVPAVTTGIAEADLLAVLRQMDPNVQTKKMDNGGIEYRLTVKIDGWSYTLRIESFANNIWLDAELGGPIADVQRIPSNLLANLLFANLKIGPTHFTFMKNNGNYQLNACRMVARTISTDGFRTEIEQFCKQVRETYPQWNAVIAASK